MTDGQLGQTGACVPTRGPLRRCAANPRYFADADGRPVYLTGSHTWSCIQELLGPDVRRVFDFAGYLDWLESYGFNFIRGWMWEQTTWDNFTPERVPLRPLPFRRTGPGAALDGLPRFDLTAFDEAYFNRLRTRVGEAGRRGFYVSVMLFQGWSVNDRTGKGANPWHGHPFNKANNINGIDGDPNGTDGGRRTHTLADPSVTRLQEAYVRRVIDTVNDLDNVLYEIGNEHYEETWPWQCQMLAFIKDYQQSKPNQHPAGITSGGGGKDAVTNAQLDRSPADWISPRHEPGTPYRDDPPPADGAKVILADTDHLWGMGGYPGWVWKSFCRGLNPILMDPYEPIYGLERFKVWGDVNERDNPLWDPLRKNLAHSLAVARSLDLANAVPHGELCSTGFCLAQPGTAYVAYFPEPGGGTLDLAAAAGPMAVEWYEPNTFRVVPGEPVEGGAARSPLKPPFDSDAVACVRRV
ncbi:MAG: DUF4038 domain-containing protein [Kiritimatiellae bacterium]|nr:DUF4038 domain-containing protein [Kiritimatiellia bacterium]